MNEQPLQTGVYIRLILTMIFWGGTFVAGRIAGTEMHPITAATGRFVLAAAVLLGFIYCRDRRFTPLSLPQWGAMLLLGLTGIFAYNLFFFTGLQHVEAGRGSMIIAANPVVTTVLSILIFRERFSIVRSLGIALSISGAALVVSRGDLSILYRGNVGYGELCMLGAVLSWSAYTLIGRKLLVKISPLTAVAYSCTVGAILLFLMDISLGMTAQLFTLSLSGRLAVGYLAFFGTALGFIWFYDGVRTLGAGRASLFVNLVPVSGVVFGVLILGEQPGLSLLGGGLLVLLGLLLINRR